VSSAGRNPSAPSGLPRHVVEPARDDIRGREGDHRAEFAPTDELDRLAAKARRQHAIEARRRAATLQVAEHDRPRFLARFRRECFGDLSADPPRRPGKPWRAASITTASRPAGTRLPPRRRCRTSRPADRGRTAAPTPRLQNWCAIARVPSPPMTTSASSPPCETSRRRDRNNRGCPPRSPPDARTDCRVGGAEDGAAEPEDAGDVSQRERARSIRLDEAVETVFEADDLDAAVGRGLDHGADDCVEAGRIAAAGEDADAVDR